MSTKLKKISTVSKTSSGVNEPTKQENVKECEGLKIYDPPKGWGCRHTVATMTFFGCVASYCMRINLSMAIVSMTSANATNSSSDQCAYPDSYDPNDHTEGEFDWTSNEKGIILGAFFWGYVVSHVPAGMLAEKIGAKWVFGLGMLLTAIFQLLTPLSAKWGMWALIINRIIQGLGEGVTPPATHVLLAQWSPPFERSKLGSFVYAGNQGGTMCAMLISGAIIDADFLGGWPGVFYVFGVCGLIWFALWGFLVYNKPTEHPRISQEELHYIQGSLGGQTSQHNIPTPWKEVFSSKAVWAILIAQLGNGWGLYTLLTYMPTYMNDVLHFDIKQNSLLSALPYFCMVVAALFTSWFADFLRTKQLMTTTLTRKFFNTVGHWGPSVALIGVAYSGCDKVLAVTLLTFAVGLSGFIGAGYQVNHIDIAPNHAGVLMGVCNGVANLAGIAAPYVAGSITDADKSSLTRWRIVFFLAAGIYFVDNLVYIIFGTGVEQPWNRSGENRPETLNDKEEEDKKE